MELITNLETWKFKEITEKKTETKDGITEQTTLSGKRFNIISFIDYVYDLKLWYLTKEEASSIRKALLALAKANQNLEFVTQDLEKYNFFSNSDSNRTSFMFSSSSIKVSPSQVVGFWELSLEVTERVKL